MPFQSGISPELYELRKIMMVTPMLNILCDFWCNNANNLTHFMSLLDGYVVMEAAATGLVSK